jgi:hypothetical protein
MERTARHTHGGLVIFDYTDRIERIYYEKTGYTTDSIVRLVDLMNPTGGLLN